MEGLSPSCSSYIAPEELQIKTVHINFGTVEAENLQLSQPQEEKCPEAVISFYARAFL